MWRALGKRYLKPDKKFKNVSEISLDTLKEEGVKGIILDLDDTLLPSDKKINREVIDNWLQKAKKDFLLFVVSNNARHDYVKKFCEKFDIPFVARATKPRSKFLEIAIGHMKLDKSDVIIIGDRITTDILAGKILGIRAFLVAPLAEMPSKLHRLIHRFEIFVLRLLESGHIKEEQKENINSENNNS